MPRTAIAAKAASRRMTTAERQAASLAVHKATIAAVAPKPGARDVDREIVGDSRAQLRVPLRDVVQARDALTHVKSAVDAALAQLNTAGGMSDRARLVTVRSLLRLANEQINGRA